MNSFIHKVSQFEVLLQSKKSLRIILLAIFLLNTSLYLTSDKKTFENTQVRNDASGFSSEKGYRFIYFYHYTGYFPLATLNPNLIYSKEGAEREIATNGKDLIMEFMHWSRLGEHARIFAFLPDVYLSGSTRRSSLKPFNTIVFISALMLVFYGFWRVRKPLFGLILLVMINCTPFFLFEIFSRENIFGVLGSVFFMILGLNLPIIYSKTIDYLNRAIIVVLSGIIIGFFSEIRNEVSIVIISLVLMYALSGNIKIVPKIAFVIIAIFSFNATKTSIRNYFNLKFEKTSHLVSQHNGHVYTGARISGHQIWHPIFCGLGDFDTKYGYQWYDIVAYQYAAPILKKEYKLDFNYSGKYILDDYYDDARLYYKKFDEMPEYEEVMKNKVISDIKNDPFWYLGILLKRVIRVLTTTIPVPYAGWLLFPLLYYLYRQKKWNLLRLIAISLPLSATSIIIHSGLGATYNSVFVYFVLAISILEGYHYLKNKSSSNSKSVFQGE